MLVALGVTLAMSLVGNAIVLYRALDSGVAATHCADEIDRRNQQTEDARKLMRVLLADSSRADLVGAAEKAGVRVIDKSNEELYAGEIRFAVSEDRVVAIEFN
jgi:hypothetical protein